MIGTMVLGIDSIYLISIVYIVLLVNGLLTLLQPTINIIWINLRNLRGIYDILIIRYKINCKDYDGCIVYIMLVYPIIVENILV